MPQSANNMAQGLIKKRRLRGACDICRRKKIRCNSGNMPGYQCTNCTSFGFECTHADLTKNLGSAKGYVEYLENRLEKLETLLNKLLPGMDCTRELEGDIETEASGPNPLARNDEDLTYRISRLSVNPTENHFFGKSSGIQLVQTALNFQGHYTGEPHPDSEKPVAILSLLRPEFTKPRPWHEAKLRQEIPSYTFPEHDLLTDLVDIYFIRVNPYTPLLHRPTFEMSLAEGRHLQDHQFAGVLLMICALASRFSDDPRVLIDGEDSLHSAGWKWYDQVTVIRKVMHERPTLYELQIYALSAIFLQTSSVFAAAWCQIGIGMRLLVSVGAHRRRGSGPPTAENELWKRAFWVLYTLDRSGGWLSGRPCTLHEEDYDVDLPIECDDAYWDHPDPDLNFKQPAGKPSEMAFFLCHLKLLDILPRILRAIYPVRKPLSTFDHQTISELDSALNAWLNAVPGHLRWNPNRKNRMFANQSTLLYGTYYHLQITVHRPFIPTPRQSSPFAYPSLSICANAARSCIHLINIRERNNIMWFGYFQAAAFTSGLVLLLNTWSGKRSGFAHNARRELDDIKRCVSMFKMLETRWHSAGLSWDILARFASAGDMSLAPPTSLSTKRRRDSDVQPSTDSSTSASPAASITPSDEAAPPSPYPIQATNEQPSSSFALPYSSDLARLPLFYEWFGDQRNIAPQSQQSTQWSMSSFPPLDELHQPGPSHLGNTGMTSGLAFPDENLPDNPLTPFSDGSAQRNLGLGPLDLEQFFPVGPNPPEPGPMMDRDTLAMWSNAPPGLDVDAWENYISSVDMVTHFSGTVPRQSW